MVSSLPNGWHIARFDEILTKVDRKFIIDDGQEYDCMGVRWYGNGAFIRERQWGVDIRRKQQWIIRSGDVVYNKLFAWKNAFAIADDTVDGCIVSDKFPTYQIKPELIDPKLLAYYFTTQQIGLQAQDLSKGAAAISKLTLNPPQFWDLTIPLPPIDEQHNIVAHIETLERRIAEAQKLRQETLEQTSLIQSRAFDSLLDEQKFTFLPIKEILAESPRNGLSIPASGIGTTGILFAKVGIVNYGTMNPAETKRVEIELPEDSPYWMQPDDIFVSRGNSLELVGSAAVYNGIPENCAFPDLLIRLRVNTAIIAPQFLVSYFYSRKARKYIESVASGTSPSMKKISQPKLERMLVPVPPLDEQHRIVAYLDDLSERVNELRRLQSESQEELDALLLSVLDRAFKGEL